MPTVADTITVPSGAGVYGGRFPPVPPSLTWTAPSPAGSEVGVASGIFTATLVDGVAAVVVTPLSTLAGTWAPSSRTLSPAAPGGTFTFTPAAAGSHSATLANNAGIASPAALSYVVTVPTVRAMTFAAADTATVNVAVSGSITNTGNVSQAWSITPPSGVTVTPSSGTLAAGATQALSITATAAATYSLTLAASGATIAGNPQSIVTSPATATGFSLAGPTSGTTGSPATFTVTPIGGPLSAAATVNLTAPGATLSTASLSFASGATAGQTFTVNRAADGTTLVSMTNTLGLTNGTAISFTSVAPVAPGTPFTTLTLSGADGTAKPFTAGHAFKQGDVPAGTSVLMTGASVNGQATIKSTWPDGSAKVSVLAGTATISGGTAVLSLASGAAASGTALTTADLIATGVTASVDAGAFGSASFGSTEWAAPFQTWVSGPRMSSWVYRKQIGADPHLVAWLEVRLWLTGAVEVLPWVENGYLNVAGPTNKSATYSFTLGGTQRFSKAIDLKHHLRTPLIDGPELSYWLGADPGIVPKHDSAYLMATELVPTYLASVPTDSALITALPATYAPLQQGSFRYAFTSTNPSTGETNDDMSTGGYGPPIGLLPQHDMLGLVSSANTYASVVRNGFSAGRYHLHYRDEATNLPIRFSDWPNLVLSQSASGVKDVGASSFNQYCPTPTGGGWAGWDVAHSPSVGFMAYLLTGRFYFMEQVQFAANIHYLQNTDTAPSRNGSQGLLQPRGGAWQTRAMAWSIRTLAQALCVTPDEDTFLRPEYVASMEANIAHFHGRYVTGNNPFGAVLMDVDYNTDATRFVGAPWMQDFSIAAWGYAQAMGLPVGSTPRANMAAFFDWHARFVVGRLGSSASPDWWWVNGAIYRMTISTSKTPDFETGTGPWYASWRAMYDDTQTYAGVNTFGASEGTMAAEILPGAEALWGNLMPALAYAVRYGVAGATDAYNRVTTANNWQALLSQFATIPVWSVQPRLPSWAVGRAVGSLFEIAGTALSPSVSSLASTVFGNLFSYGAFVGNAAGGGHNDYFGNEVYAADFRADLPQWQTWKERTPVGDITLASSYNAIDGTPGSRHEYNSQHWSATKQRVLLHGVMSSNGAVGGNTPFATDGFDPISKTWDNQGTLPPSPYPDALGQPCGKDGEDRVWARSGAGYAYNELWLRSPSTGVWSQVQTYSTPPYLPYRMVLDTLRNVMFGIQAGDGWVNHGAVSACTISTSAPYTRNIITLTSTDGSLAYYEAAVTILDDIVYDPWNDQFILYGGLPYPAGSGKQRLYSIKLTGANSGTFSYLSNSGITVPEAKAAHSRLALMPFGFLLLVDDISTNVKAMRLK